MFGYSVERKLERQMIADYERLLDVIAGRLDQSNYETAVALAELPLVIKGFGHVKMANTRPRNPARPICSSVPESGPVKVAAE